jgi:hypothetical protein
MLKHVLGSCRAATPTSGQRPLPPHGGEEISVCQSGACVHSTQEDRPGGAVSPHGWLIEDALNVRKQCIYRQLMEVLWLYLQGG